MSYEIIKDMKLIDVDNYYVLLWRGDSNNVSPKAFFIKMYIMDKSELEKVVENIARNDKLYRMEILKDKDLLKTALIESKGNEKDMLKFKFRLSSKDKSIVDEWLNKYPNIYKDYYGYYCVDVEWSEVKNWLKKEGVYISVIKGRINRGIKHWYKTNVLVKDILTLEEIHNIILENDIDWMYIEGYKVVGDGLIEKKPVYFKKVFQNNKVGIFDRYGDNRYYPVYFTDDVKTRKYLVYMPKLEYLK